MSVVNLTISVDTSGLRDIRGRVKPAEAWSAVQVRDFMLVGMLRDAPVDTGLLWSKIRGIAVGGEFEAGSYVFYSIFQEYGTKGPGRGQPGTPHVRPTFEKVPWDAITQGALQVMGV